MAFGLWMLALVAVALWARRRGRTASAWSAATGWLALPLYNTWVVAHCPGDCGIRVDLVLIVPFLVLLSLFALWKFMHHRRQRR